MKVIHKQFLDVRGDNQQTMAVPVGSRILSCDFMGNSLAVWYIFAVAEEENKTSRDFYLVRTGEVVPDFVDSSKVTFIQTAYDRADHHPFVIHLFEIL